jgi:hypothetical protein
MKRLLHGRHAAVDARGPCSHIGDANCLVVDASDGALATVLKLGAAQVVRGETRTLRS